MLADQGLIQRRTILAAGCVGSGVVTGLLAFFTSWYPMVALRALNGACLAGLRPTLSSLISDSIVEGKQGNIYSRVQTSAEVGVALLSLIATPISTQQVLGMQGWRTCFLGMCFVSLALAALIALRMEEPARKGADSSAWNQEEGVLSVLKQELSRLQTIFVTPTSVLLMAQGVFGAVPWAALHYATLFFQTAGLSSLSAGIVTSLSKVAMAVGILTGGVVGDFCTRRSRYHGRTLAAQFSTLVAIPLVYLIFSGIAPGPEALGWYLVMFVGFNLIAAWQIVGTKWQMFAEIAPAESRSMVAAWDAAVEGFAGAIFGGPLVALLAQRYFGYGFGAEPSSQDARALGKALSWVSIVPFLVCFVLCSVMHWSWPSDLRKMAGDQREVEDKHQVLDLGKVTHTIGVVV